MKYGFSLAIAKLEDLRENQTKILKAHDGNSFALSRRSEIIAHGRKEITSKLLSVN